MRKRKARGRGIFFSIELQEGDNNDGVKENRYEREK